MAIVKDLLVTGDVKVSGEMSVSGSDLKAMMLEMAHPVGSYYWSSDPTDPSELFGGTWSRVKGKFLYAADDSTSAGATGGSASASYTPSGSVGYHTVTTSEMPGHNHCTSGWHVMQFSTGSSSDWGNGYGLLNSDDGSWADRAKIESGMNTLGGSGSHNHGFTGSSASIPTVPPYVAAYCWRRTA